MKTRKYSLPRNFEVATECYTEVAIANMEAKGEISNLHNKFPNFFEQDHYVVFCKDCTEIKIVYDVEYGHYCIHKDGLAIYVNI